MNFDELKKSARQQAVSDKLDGTYDPELMVIRMKSKISRTMKFACRKFGIDLDKHIFDDIKEIYIKTGDDYDDGKITEIEDC